MKLEFEKGSKNILYLYVGKVTRHKHTLTSANTLTAVETNTNQIHTSSKLIKRSRFLLFYYFIIDSANISYALRGEIDNRPFV